MNLQMERIIRHHHLLRLAFGLILGIFSVQPVVVAGKVRSVEVSFQEKIPSPRWMYDSAISVPKKGIAGKLAKMKQAQRQGKWKTCYTQGNSLNSGALGVRFWVLKAQMDCLENWAKVSGKARVYLLTTLEKIEKSGYLQSRMSQKALLGSYLKSYLLLLAKKIHENRSVAWKMVYKLQKWESSLSETQLADLYYLAGELAFVEQKMSAAYDFFGRSLNQRNRKDVVQKIKILERTAPYLKSHPKLPTTGSGQSSNLKFSDKEVSLKKRMEQSKKSKDLVSVVEDGVELIEKFPGSENSDWAEDEILSIFLGAIKKNDEKFELFRSKILRSMKKADARRLLRWGRNAYYRGAYLEALTLCEVALKKMSPHPKERDLLLLAANSANSAGRVSLAESYYEKLILRHGGSGLSHEGTFRLGLLKFREKEYSKAAFYFEKLLASEVNSDFHGEAMYWRWQSYKKLKKDEAENAARALMDRFPLTYYGLRARAELNNGEILWKGSDKGAQKTFFEDKKLKLSLNLTEFENQSYERLRILLSAGWFDEAQFEMRRLPDSVNSSQKVAKALLWAKSLNHYESIRLMNDAWDEDEGMRTRRAVEAIFPFEFKEIIDKEAEKFQVPPNFVRALIRQESSFRPEVISSSNAHGLMQIIPLTARDIAKYLRIKKPVRIPEDLFDVHKNVYFGSSYINRMIRAFDGHFPLALAAYNAGIGRVRKWVAARPDLGVQTKHLTSDPEQEIWIDEMPWSETRGYVKAVMRNFLIYELIEKGKVKINDPVWKVSAD